MAGRVEGIRRALVLGLVLIAGTAIEQVPTLSPLDLCTDPAGVTALLARWTEKLADH